MNKHLLTVGIAVLLICVGLSGCFDELGTQSDGESNTADRFVGTWDAKNENMYHVLGGVGVITFFSDGTFTTNTFLSGIWELKDGKLFITITIEGLSYSLDYSFKTGGYYLYLTDSNGKIKVYKKEASIESDKYDLVTLGQLIHFPDNYDGKTVILHCYFSSLKDDKVLMKNKEETTAIEFSLPSGFDTSIFTPLNSDGYYCTGLFTVNYIGDEGSTFNVEFDVTDIQLV